MRLKIVLTLALFLGFGGSLLSMLEWRLNTFTMLFTAPLSISGLGNGFLLIFNRLFYVSEQQQLFRYTMFHVSSPQADWGGNIAAALVVIFIVFAIVSFALVICRRKILLIIAILMVIGVQIYFGVFSDAFWNILLLTALALSLVKERLTIRGIIPVLVAVALAAVAVWTVYPDRNPWLHELSEGIRDRFNTPISPYDIANQGMRDAHFDTADLALAVASVGEDTLHDAAIQEYHIETDEVSHGAEAGFFSLDVSLLPAIIFVIMVAFTAIIIRYIPPLLRAAKRQKAFEISDCRIAIDSMFAHLLQWLEIIGLERKNVVYSAYAIQLAEIVSQQYSQEYEDATALWQKAMYSNHVLGETERKIMRRFLDMTKDYIWEKSNIRTKLKIKFYHFL